MEKGGKVKTKQKEGSEGRKEYVVRNMRNLGNIY